MNADAASLHGNPVAETVYNVRRQQGIVVKSQVHYISPAGYQRRHEAKGYAETEKSLVSVEEISTKRLRL